MNLQPIVRLRMRGYKPAAVVLLDLDVQVRWPIEQQLQDHLFPTVVVFGDEPALCDCRPLTGVQVHLVSDDLARAMGWVERLLQAGVPMVIQSNSHGEVYTWKS